MAKDDDKPLLKGEFREEIAKVLRGVETDIGKLRQDLGELLAGKLGKDDVVAGVLELSRRLDALESSLTDPAGEPGNAVHSVVEKKRRQKGEAVLRNGAVVTFHPHEGGPDLAAIVCGGRFLREGFPAVYSLYVLEPRKARWEENVKEGDQPGTFAVL